MPGEFQGAVSFCFLGSVIASKCSHTWFFCFRVSVWFYLFLFLCFSGLWGLNSCHHACMASTLLTTVSPAPHLLLLDQI